jgi:hypothetical protein
MELFLELASEEKERGRGKEEETLTGCICEAKKWGWFKGLCHGIRKYFYIVFCVRVL